MCKWKQYMTDKAWTIQIQCYNYWLDIQNKMKLITITTYKKYIPNGKNLNEKGKTKLLERNKRK